MDNSAISKVERKWKVILKWTSGKKLTLNDVLYVSDICKNLIFRSILSKKIFRIVFEPDKFVLTKRRVYVGKGYLVDGFFKANVAVVDKKSVYLYSKLINKWKASVYFLESLMLWYARLEHINYKSLQNLSNVGYIPKLKLEEIYKCEICVEAKFAKNSFHSIDRNTEPLEIIHSDLCDLKFTLTRDGKKYFITFIDDCTRTIMCIF